MNSNKANRRPTAWAWILMAVIAPAVWAESPDMLPVTIEASRAEFDEKRGTSIYTGNVSLVYDDLRLAGERLEVKHNSRTGAVDVQLTGKPASASRSGEPALNAAAGEMEFSSVSRVLTLKGSASLARGQERLSGENIRYDLDADRILADSQDGEPVQIILQPPRQPSQDTP